MPKRHPDPPRPHFFEPELPACVAWRPRRRWPLGVTVQCRALNHLTALLDQRRAVWADKDAEAVHQIRVATRRLRSTLQTFAALWPEEDARRWVRELGRFAEAFGEARDLDVRLAECAADEGRLSEDEGPQDDQRQRAREFLARRWRRRRADLRHDLRRTLVRFEQAWTPQRLMELLTTTPLDLWRWSSEQQASVDGSDERSIGDPAPDVDAPADTDAGARADTSAADTDADRSSAAGPGSAAGGSSEAPPAEAQPLTADGAATPAEPAERRAPRRPSRRGPRA